MFPKFQKIINNNIKYNIFSKFYYCGFNEGKQNKNFKLMFSFAFCTALACVN